MSFWKFFFSEWLPWLLSLGTRKTKRLAGACYEPRYTSWFKFKRELETANPLSNTPHCDEHFIQFQHCLYMHVAQDLRLEKQVNSAFQSHTTN